MSTYREYDKPGIYKIMVKGHLDQKWSDWFDGFSIEFQPDDETLLVGPVNDQPALHGLLAKLRDLGLPILNIERLEPKLLNDDIF